MSEPTISRAERLRARLAADKQKSTYSEDRKPGGDNAAYRFFDMKVGQDAKVRFLPDADEDNDYFWVKRETIRLPFDGIVGGDYATDKPASVTVPCVDMFDGAGKCEIIAHMKPFWKDKEDKAAIAIARTYWKKRSYIFQGFVKNSPFVEENVPENPIRRFILGPMLYALIDKAVSNPEMIDLPCDYQNGRDFTISKTQQGEHANYSTSAWSMNPRRLDEVEMDAINTHHLYDLRTFMGRNPDTEERAIIKAMFLDSLDGKPFDFDSYGKYYRAYTDRDNADSDAVSQVASQSHSEPRTVARVENVVTDTPKTVKAAQEAPETVTEAAKPAAASGKKAADIIAQIREKQRAQSAT